jgi:hypothetical protein
MATMAGEAHESRQVKGGAEAGLPFFKQELKALVRLRSAPKARELAHSPQPAAVHGGVDAARERILAGVAELGIGVEIVEAIGRVECFDGNTTHRRRRRVAQRGGGGFLLPAVAGGGVGDGGHVEILRGEAGLLPQRGSLLL